MENKSVIVNCDHCIEAVKAAQKEQSISASGQKMWSKAKTGLFKPKSREEQACFYIL